MRSKSFFVRFLLLAGIGGIFSLSGWVAYRTWPQTIDTQLSPCLPIVRIEGNRLAIQLRTDALLANVGEYRSELEAYLHYEYLKSHAGLDGPRVLLPVRHADAGPLYEIHLVLDNDLLSDLPYLGRLTAKGYIPDYQLLPVSFEGLARMRLETSVFLGSYNPTQTPRLSSLSTSQLLIPLARFLVFKSRTDRRVRERIEPVPTTLTFDQAKELSADILDVIHFYDLPLDVFLGIGAMENNYMNVRGDLDHSVWKRRPQRGDIVLRRERGRVLVSDYAMGIWQITRETLRSAHDLYMKDKRDYSVLPPRLRPPKHLSFDIDNSEVLTTYAGLLLRHLLDKADGNIEIAAGAYNGSLRKPNLQYAAGVRAVALYARSFLERTANLDGMNVAENWLIKRPSHTLNSEIANIRPALSSSNLSPRSRQNLPAAE